MAPICPACQAENRAGARFCDQCGTTLPVPCPACGNLPRAGAKFCDACGQPLSPAVAGGVARAGAAAGTGGPAPGAGRPAAAAAAPAPPGVALDLARFIPPALLEKLEDARASGGMVGERRVVTMLFCDVKGSTAAAGQLDPEDWAEVMNGAFARLIAPVYRYEGTLARMMGDAILAFFGAPLAHEDDARRAVLAGLDMVREIQPYADEVCQRWGVTFGVRVGINTGLVMVGPVGSDLHMEYTALGDAINLAARMEQTAQPGSVQIAEPTYRRVAQAFECEDLGGLAVKGKAEPVHAYRVLGPRSAAAAAGSAPRPEAPLTGREEELAALQAALGAVQAGQGRLVCLLGEAGLGKSRLIREMRQAWAGRWCECAGLSYEAGHPYGLFQRLVAAAAASAEGAAVAVPASAGAATAAANQEARLARLVEGLPADLPDGVQAQALPVLRALFNLGTPDGTPALEGEAFQRQLFQLMPALVRSWAARAPLALVFDDLHWADPASLALLQQLFPLAGQAPLLLLCALRPEAQSPAWALKALAEREHAAYFSALEVRPLSPEDSSALVDHLLRAEGGPRPALRPGLRERLLARAEGNPLFLEEVLRALAEAAAGRQGQAASGQPDAELEIPETLLSLLTARIDRLPEEARRTLQMAAVIGRTFQHTVLGAVLGPGAALEERLRQLEQAGLIQALGGARGAAAEYAFRHALVHEAAYQTILRKHRRDFHRRAGEALEALFPHRVEQTAPALGFHFAEAGEPARALKYYILAGDAAFRMYANAEAIAHYTRAAELARRTEAASEVLRHVYARLGRAQELNAQDKAALASYAELEALGTQRDDPALVLAALAAQGQIRAMGSGAEGDAAQAESLLGRALRLAQQLDDRAAEARVQWSLSHLYNWTGRIPAALAAGDRSLALARELGLDEQRAFTLNDLAYVCVAGGQPQRARALTEEAIPLWRQLNNQPMLANSLAFASILSTQAGEHDTAIRLSDDAYQVSARIGNRWGMAFSRTAIGLSWLDRGDPAQAIRLLQSAIEDGRQSGFVVPQFSSRSFLALTYAELGDTTHGLRLLETPDSQPKVPAPARFVPVLEATRLQLHLRAGNVPAAEAIAAANPSLLDTSALNYVPGAAYQLLGVAASAHCQLRLAQGQPAEAAALADHYLAVIRRLQGGRFEPELLYWRARAQAALGQDQAARLGLQQAEAIARAQGCRRMLWLILRALGALAGRAGQPGEAAALQAAAQEVIDYIAERAAPVGLKEAFLRRANEAPR